MAHNQLQQRIDEVSGGIIGLLAGLTDARVSLGDARVTEFLDIMPQKGEVLWRHFLADKEEYECTFVDFVRVAISQYQWS
ncbi:MAG: hypothetical protein Q7S11_01415 [bacterium]|nr:hypothetical protein [bacterium]